MPHDHTPSTSPYSQPMRQVSMPGRHRGRRLAENSAAVAQVVAAAMVTHCHPHQKSKNLTSDEKAISKLADGGCDAPAAVGKIRSPVHLLTMAGSAVRGRPMINFTDVCQGLPVLRQIKLVLGETKRSKICHNVHSELDRARSAGAQFLSTPVSAKSHLRPTNEWDRTAHGHSGRGETGVRQA